MGMQYASSLLCGAAVEEGGGWRANVGVQAKVSCCCLFVLTGKSATETSMAGFLSAIWTLSDDEPYSRTCM